MENIIYINTCTHILFLAFNWLKETGNKRVLAEQVIDMFCVGYDLFFRLFGA